MKSSLNLDTTNIWGETYIGSIDACNCLLGKKTSFSTKDTP